MIGWIIFGVIALFICVFLYGCCVVSSRAEEQIEKIQNENTWED